MYENFDVLDEIYAKLKINKGECWKNTYFIAFCVLAAVCGVLGLILFKTLYAFMLALLAAVWLAVALLSVFAAALDNKRARTMVEDKAYEYGLDTLYNDFRDASEFLNKRIYIGRKFVYVIPGRLIKLSDAIGFEVGVGRYRGFFLPEVYYLYILYNKNGRKKKSLVGKLDYSLYRKQFNDISKKLKRVQEQYL